jgi:hypothetical protein
MTETQVRQDIAFLEAEVNKMMTKWRRSFNRYVNNGRRIEDLRNQYGQPLAYYNQNEGEDEGTTPNLNVIRACIDTHVSKISETKVRPFFNPTGGTFKTLKTCRNAQLFFDQLFEEQDVYRKAIEIARRSDIFERGILWLDDELLKFITLNPWEYLFDPSEWNAGRLTRCCIQRSQYPLIYLKDKLKENAKDGEVAEVLRQLEEKQSLKGKYEIYYDLIDKKRWTFAAGKLIEKADIEFDVPPAAVLYLEQPIKGNQSVSMADNTFTIQTQVDSLCHKIHLAYELNPAQTHWVVEGSNVKVSMLSNEIGQTAPYKYLPGMTTPVVTSTPAPIDPSYTAGLQFWIAQAMEMNGISQLSAQAKNPLGNNPSGVALETVENVESDRHNPWQQSFIHFFMEIANIFIQIAPSNASVLPKKLGRARITWSEIKQERESFAIQFSASSSLSKDPQKKMEQIQQLIAMNVINPALAAVLLEFPDLQAAYSITTASYDYCQRVIERAVEDEKYDFFEGVNLQQLFGETVNTLLRLDANDEEREVLDRLVHLAEIIKTKMDAMDDAASAQQAMIASQQPGPFPGKPPQAQGPTGPLPIQGQQPPAPAGGGGPSAAPGPMTAPAQSSAPVPSGTA